MKTYNISMTVSINTGNIGDYASSKPVYFSIAEMLPANVDAQKHLRQRLAEELKRNFDALLDPIDNKTEEAKSSEDPLESF